MNENFCWKSSVITTVAIVGLSFLAHACDKKEDSKYALLQDHLALRDRFEKDHDILIRTESRLETILRMMGTPK